MVAFGSPIHVIVAFEHCLEQSVHACVFSTGSMEKGRCKPAVRSCRPEGSRPDSWVAAADVEPYRGVLCSVTALPWLATFSTNILENLQAHGHCSLHVCAPRYLVTEFAHSSPPASYIREECRVLYIRMPNW
ncbi:uncharacterized protein PV07_05369 [Cladophialophora immunda]|uniref:Uncharacterized protein n=1 Tax=Cladophialophora immunda TaxID=569365 RepID=A0A0D1ZNQ1_9EURO|nr:uncharacterized protein PV07_05369 [Cladophialophora immunda]KIW29561.1 hypothetical protein PV07_05369 [Cladophialophora immunda]